MLNEVVVTKINDPLNSVDEALDTAVQAAKEEMEDVRATVSGARPPLGSSVSDITHKTCDPISYGLFFLTVLVARAIPRENAAVHGLIDGCVPRSTWPIRCGPGLCQGIRRARSPCRQSTSYPQTSWPSSGKRVSHVNTNDRAISPGEPSDEPRQEMAVPGPP